MKKSVVVSLVLIGLVAVSFARPPRRGDFPGYGFLPKEDTGVLRFLQQYPEYDGRGVVVAIFDTGVDPGAPGLQVTSDGKPKIVDVVDGSGSGDVDTSTVVQAKDGIIEGLKGRKLSIDPGWTNPTGQYHVGLKPAYELFPGGLVSRLKEKRRENWDAKQRAAITSLQRELAAWKKANPTPSDDQKKEREDLEARIEQLEALQAGYDDPGPIYNCVVFHDGEVWRVAIDTDEDNDLADEELLTNYRIEREYDTFGDEDLMNYAVNVYEDGNLLSIVCDSGAHGTHVAGIVAACFPDQPELSGIAPGAQIVSVKIGDTRLGSTSVGTGEVRGCVAVLQNNCDLINMSYGGPTSDPNDGRTTAVYNDIVNKHNVIFVASAGNEGPALSTVGAPGATTEAILGIGAYVSPPMMEVQYSMRELLPPNQYTWSSRGPTYDGALGVKFSAPGGAIALVPNWVLQRNMLMNGTSMSSPNCCGNIALALSGLKAEGVEYSPRSVRRAFENTAIDVPEIEVFALGRGLIQIDRAYEYLKAYHGSPDNDVRYDVRVPGRNNARGVYLREPNETDRPHNIRFTVTPRFHEDADNRAKVDFELRCKVEATARWIECAEYMLLMHGGRRMDIRIDPTRLPEGVHYEEIRGYDADKPERGPIWRLPITVIRPETVDAESEYTWAAEYTFEPGQVERAFLVVPDGATWADIRLRRLDDDESRLMILHTIQLVPGHSYQEYELHNYIPLDPQAEEVRSIKVAGGRTIEVTLAQYWSRLGTTDCAIDVTFHGIKPVPECLALDGGAVGTPLDVTASLRDATIAPSASLDTLRKTIRPKEASIRPLDDERDALPEERQIYELILEYAFSLDEDATIRPVVSMTEITEYEETWWSQIYMLFDDAKRLIKTGTSDPSFSKLKKGDYVVRFLLRYDDLEALEGLKEMPMFIDREISPVSVSFYEDPDNILDRGGKFGRRELHPGERVHLYATVPSADDMPDAAAPGDLLLGNVTYGTGAPGELGAGKRPDGYPVYCVVPPKPSAKQDTDGAADDEKKDAAQQLEEDLRDWKVARLSKLYDDEHRALFDQIATEVLADKPGYLPVLIEKLKRADHGDDKDYTAVVEAADRIVAEVDEAALAAHFGQKVVPDDKEAKKLHKKMEEKKAALIEALHRKAGALLALAQEETPAGRPETEQQANQSRERREAFEKAFAHLQKWVETESGDYVMLHIDREILHGRLGEALALLNKQIDKKPTDKDLYEKRLTLLDKLDWSHWKDYEQKWMIIRFPEAYPPM